MSDLRRLSALIYHLPTYGPCALGQALGIYEESETETSFEDVVAMNPGLFGAN